MKAVFKDRVIFLVLLLVFHLIATCSYGGEKEKEGGTSVKSKGKKEILVAHNITTDHPFWCGRDGLIYTLMGNGVYYHNVETDHKDKVAESGSMPLACSHDGGWLVYIDKDRLRHDDGNIETKVVDVWRYEFKTKRRQRFAVARYDELSSIGSGVLSPTETRAFLGKQPHVRLTMPDPQWDIVWTQEKAGLMAWFHDSSAFVRVYGGEGKDRLLVEVLGPERKVIFLEQRAKYILHILTDRQNRVYMQVSNEEFEPDLINEMIRCSVNLKGEKRERLSCTPVLEDYSVKVFDVLSSGAGFAFMEWRVDGCVKVVRTDIVEAPCITEASYHPGFYLDISPDDKWVAFVSLRKKEDDTFVNDLYLVKLKE